MRAIASYRFKTTTTAVFDFPGTARRLDARRQRAGAWIAAWKRFSQQRKNRRTGKRAGGGRVCGSCLAGLAQMPDRRPRRITLRTQRFTTRDQAAVS
jgi:hypothetical protein